MVHPSFREDRIAITFVPIEGTLENVVHYVEVIEALVQVKKQEDLLEVSLVKNVYRIT